MELEEARVDWRVRARCERCGRASARRTVGEGRRWPPAGVCASAQRTPTSLQQAALRLLLLKMMGWAGRALVLACAGVWSCAQPAAASLAHEHSAMAAADDAPGAGASGALSCLLPADQPRAEIGAPPGLQRPCGGQGGPDASNRTWATGEAHQHGTLASQAPAAEPWSTLFAQEAALETVRAVLAVAQGALGTHVQQIGCVTATVEPGVITLPGNASLAAPAAGLPWAFTHVVSAVHVADAVTSVAGVVVPAVLDTAAAVSVTVLDAAITAIWWWVAMMGEYLGVLPWFATGGAVVLSAVTAIMAPVAAPAALLLAAGVSVSTWLLLLASARPARASLDKFPRLAGLLSGRSTPKSCTTTLLFRPRSFSGRHAELSMQTWNSTFRQDADPGAVWGSILTLSAEQLRIKIHHH